MPAFPFRTQESECISKQRLYLMKIRLFYRFIAQAREGSSFLSKMMRYILISLAGLVIPVMSSASPAESPPGVAAAQQRETGPDYSAGKLVGTMLSSGLSGAVFENSAGEQKFYRKGITFSDGSRIVAVACRIVLWNGLYQSLWSFGRRSDKGN